MKLSLLRMRAQIHSPSHPRGCQCPHCRHGDGTVSFDRPNARAMCAGWRAVGPAPMGEALTAGAAAAAGAAGRPHSKTAGSANNLPYSQHHCNWGLPAHWKQAARSAAGLPVATCSVLPAGRHMGAHTPRAIPNMATLCT